VEDGTPGYRLLKEPTARAAELAVRAFALDHEDELLQILTTSADGAQRAIAADVLGFGARSPRQMAALVRGVRDPDSEVRNNSTRALAEILSGDPSLAAQIPADNFIQMIQSGIWTDRNKASVVLYRLTQSRDPQLLARLNAEAGDALQEMANWRGGWAMWPRFVLERIAGRSEVWAFFRGLRVSLAQGAAIAALLSAALALLWVRARSRGAAWTLGLLIPLAIAAVLYWVALGISGVRISEYGVLAVWFIAPWYAAGAAASSAIVIYSRRLRHS
jgi:hypothetical protein